MKNLPLLLNPATDRDTAGWATVTALAPLRIRFDGEAAPLPFTPDSLVSVLQVGDRVWVALATNDDPGFKARRVVIIGRSGGLQGTAPFAILRRVSPQSLIDNTNIPVDWDTAIRDTHNGWADAGTNPSRYTLPLSGVYMMSGLASWSANATNRRAVHLLLDGANVDGTQIIATAQAVSTTSLFFSAPVVGNAGQYIGVNMWQNSGATLTGGSGLTAVTVTIEYKGP